MTNERCSRGWSSIRPGRVRSRRQLILATATVRAVYTVRPHLMFFGDAQRALDLYVSAFNDAHVKGISRYGPEGAGPVGSIERAILLLGSQEVVVIDSPPVHDFTFTPAMSLYVEFDTSTELDLAFAALADGGAHTHAARRLPLQRTFRMASGSLRSVLATESPRSSDCRPAHAGARGPLLTQPLSAARPRRVIHAARTAPALVCHRSPP